jgi:hypothetical protein
MIPQTVSGAARSQSQNAEIVLVAVPGVEDGDATAWFASEGGQHSLPFRVGVVEGRDAPPPPRELMRFTLVGQIQQDPG